MDLALAFHMPDDVLAETLTEERFGRWFAYARKKMLPRRSNELYLAQVALTQAATMGGGSQLTLNDFLFDERLGAAIPDDPEEQLEMAIEAFEFKPRNAKE